MSDGGGGGMFGPAASTVSAQTPAQGPTDTGAQYAPTQQGSVYRPNYQRYQPQGETAQPQSRQFSDYQSGLQAAMLQMMQQYNRPMMRAPMQQGLEPYSSPALQYRPDMSGITANLNRVAPSVAEQQRLQAVEDARIAAEKAEQDRRQRQANNGTLGGIGRRGQAGG